jgi:hypothetical protein
VPRPRRCIMCFIAVKMNLVAARGGSAQTFSGAVGKIFCGGSLMIDLGMLLPASLGASCSPVHPRSKFTAARRCGSGARGNHLKVAPATIRGRW